MPTPPLATTGTVQEDVIARISSTSKPSLVPSRSIEVTRSSPAPRSWHSTAHLHASIPVANRPPCVNTSQLAPRSPRLSAELASSPASVIGMRILASIATTTHWLPSASASLRMSDGSPTAAVLIATLSAPARNNLVASSIVRTPPPTVSGMKTCSAARLTTSTIVARPCDDAVMSRKITSSAPSSS